MPQGVALIERLPRGKSKVLNPCGFMDGPGVPAEAGPCLTKGWVGIQPFRGGLLPGPEWLERTPIPLTLMAATIR